MLKYMEERYYEKNDDVGIRGDDGSSAACRLR